MNTPTLPIALFGALLTAAIPSYAGTASTSVESARVEVVNEDTLGDIRGKFLGTNMLVGLRINLVSDWRTAGGSMQGIGTLQVERGANGEFIVHVFTDAQASPENGAGGLQPGATANGGQQIAVNGIGQVTQIAGDGNQFSNRTTISFVPGGSSGTFTTGPDNSSSSHDGMTSQVTFGPGGMMLKLSGPGGMMQQAIGGNGLMQLAQIAGENQIGSNNMHLQMMTAEMPALQQQQMGIYRALAGMQQMPR